MKYVFLFFILLSCSLSVFSQIDSEKPSIVIPAIESDKDSLDGKPVIPIAVKPLNGNSNNIPLNFPLAPRNLNFPKKEFSMFPQEEFGNPGDLYVKKLDKIEKDLLPEGHGEYAGLKKDAYWGDYVTKSKYIDIRYRDYGQVDGDLIHLLIDDVIVKANIFLNQGFKTYRYELRDGLNKIEIFAVNEGSLIPNTAEYRISDEWDKVITQRIWGLAKGVKTTLIIVKE